MSSSLRTTALGTSGREGTCSVLACVEQAAVGLCAELSLCFAGASTPRMTTHTVSVTPLSTSRTPFAPKSSRPGEQDVSQDLTGQLLQRAADCAPGTADMQGDSVSVGLGAGRRLSQAVSALPLQALLLLLAVQCAGCVLPCAVGVWAPEPALHRGLQKEDHPAGRDRCREVGAGPAAGVGLARGVPDCQADVSLGTGMTPGSSR